VKHAGLTLPDPTIFGPVSYKARMLVCSHLLVAFRGTAVFSTTDNIYVRKEVFAELSEWKDTIYSETLASSLLPMPSDTGWTIRRVNGHGMLGRDATFLIRRLLAILADKWHQPYSVVCGFFKSWLSIAIA
jgi:hypothetical protein